METMVTIVVLSFDIIGQTYCFTGYFKLADFVHLSDWQSKCTVDVAFSTAYLCDIILRNNVIM